jgi:hypothetical protein
MESFDFDEFRADFVRRITTALGLPLAQAERLAAIAAAAVATSNGDRTAYIPPRWLDAELVRRDAAKGLPMVSLMQRYGLPAAKVREILSAAWE